MLGALNLILLLIITAVIIINIILTQKRFNSIEQKVASRNFLDLAEFGKLNKEFKKNYQTYFVNGIMPHVMDNTNAFIKESNINETIKENKLELNKAIDALPYTMQASKQTSNKAEPVVKEAFGSYSLW
jgi:hypothetical protein